MATTWAQTNFCIRNDNGSETTATWKAALDTNYTQLVGAAGVILRLRIAAQETGTTASTLTARLYKSKNGGAYAQIGSGDTDGCRVAASANFADNDATTQQLTSGTFVAGRMDDATGQCTATSSISQNGRTEHEYCIELVFANLADGDYFDFRERASTTAFGTYTVTPRLTITKSTPPTVALNTPTDTGTVTSATPTFNFTATDVNGDTVEYQIQIDTVNTFDGN